MSQLNCYGTERAFRIVVIQVRLGGLGIPKPWRAMLDSRPIRLLLTEDDADTRDIVAYVLAQEGYAVTAVPDGQRALESMREAPPDVAILDFLMPGLGGDEVVSAMQREPALSLIPVISMTASPPLLRQGRVAAVVQKPFGILELVGTVRVVCADPSQR